MCGVDLGRMKMFLVVAAPPRRGGWPAPEMLTQMRSHTHGVSRDLMRAGGSINLWGGGHR